MLLQEARTFVIDMCTVLLELPNIPASTIVITLYVTERAYFSYLPICKLFFRKRSYLIYIKSILCSSSNTVSLSLSLSISHTLSLFISLFQSPFLFLSLSLILSLSFCLFFFFLFLRLSFSFSVSLSNSVSVSLSSLSGTSFLVA